ncbi:MAG: metal-sensing transcriptional repressor [Raoultibacter sp.]
MSKQKTSVSATSENLVTHDAAGECRHKQTPRSAATQKDLQTRLNRAIGQLNGVKSMLDDNRYCGDVLTQLAAAESAVKRISALVLQEHMRTCVVEQIREGNDEVVDEVMDLVRTFSK